jgi:hypothetical protein
MFSEMDTEDLIDIRFLEKYQVHLYRNSNIDHINHYRNGNYSKHTASVCS